MDNNTIIELVNRIQQLEKENAYLNSEIKEKNYKIMGLENFVEENFKEKIIRVSNYYKCEIISNSNELLEESEK